MKFGEGVPLILIALAPLAFAPGWGDGWRDPKSFLLLLGLLLLFLQRLFTNGSFGKIARGAPQLSLSFALGLFAGLLLLQCFFLPLQLSLLLPVLFGGAMVAVLLGLSKDSAHEYQGAVIRLMLVIAGIEGALVLLQFFWFDPIPEKEIRDFIKWRSTGTTGNPNVVAAYLGLHVLLFLSLTRRSLLTWFLGGVFILAPLLLTFSRSAMLALLIAAVSYSRIYRKPGFRLLTLAAALLAFAVSTTDWARQTLSTTGLLNLDSITGRWHENLHAFSYLMDQGWLWGIGWNHYRLQAGAASDFIHNEFLGALVEGGLLGLILLLLIFLAGARGFQGGASAPRAYRAIPLYVFLLCLFDFPLRNPAFLSALVLLGLIGAVQAKPAAKTPAVG